MNHLLTAVATGFYAGYLQGRARLVAVSAVALLLWLPLRNLDPPTHLPLLLVFFIVGGVIAGSAEKLFDSIDAPVIAIDEVAGVLVSLAMSPAQPLAWMLCLVVHHLLLHRLKPWPIAWIGGHLHGGIGIIGDDLVAGFYAGICLQLLWWPMAAVFS